MEGGEGRGARVHVRHVQRMGLYTGNNTCNTLQHMRKTPQHTATHCNTLQHTATHCITCAAYSKDLGILKKQLSLSLSFAVYALTHAISLCRLKNHSLSASLALVLHVDDVAVC